MKPSDIAFAVLVAFREGRTVLTRRSGQFLGQLVADDAMPLSEAQAEWLCKLAERAAVGVDHE